MTDYLDAKEKVWKLEEENKQAIRDKTSFSSALYEKTSELFKPITKKEDEIKESVIANKPQDLTPLNEKLDRN